MKKGLVYLFSLIMSQVFDVKVFANEVNLIYESNFRSLDPVKQYDAESTRAIVNIYDRLFEFSYFERPYKVRPLLLASLPVWDEETRTLRFKLKEKVYFHRNRAFKSLAERELTADDVIFSIKRFANARVNRMSYHFLRSAIVGLDEFYEKSKVLLNGQEVYKTEVSGIKKIDRYGFTIEYAHKAKPNLEVFTFAGLSIVPKKLVLDHNHDLSQVPVGTGPFYFGSRAGSKTTLLANPDYHQTTNDFSFFGGKEEKSLPLSKKIHFNLQNGKTGIVRLVKNREVDIVPMRQNLEKYVGYTVQQNILKLNDEIREFFEVKKSVQPAARIIKFNFKDPIFRNNIHLRRAIAYAFDRKSELELSEKKRGELLQSIVPPSINGSVEATLSEPWFEYSPTKAAQELAAAGYPDGIGLDPIEIDIAGKTIDVYHSFQVFKASLKRIGIKLKERFQSFPEYLDRVYESKYQLGSFFWTADYPSAENFYSLFYSGNHNPGPNDSAYRNPEYDKHYMAVLGEVSESERLEHYRSMNRILKSDVAVIPGFSPIIYELVARHIDNYSSDLIGGGRLKFLARQEQTQKGGYCTRSFSISYLLCSLGI